MMTKRIKLTIRYTIEQYLSDCQMWSRCVKTIWRFWVRRILLKS